MRTPLRQWIASVVRSLDRGQRMPEPRGAWWVVQEIRRRERGS